MQIWPCHKVATLSNYQLYQKGIKRTTKKYRPPCFCEKKSLFFVSSKSETYCIKVRFRLLWMKFECWKKSRWYESCNTWIKLRKIKTKNFVIREITYCRSAVTCTKKLVVVKKKLAFSGHFSIWKPALVFWKK